MNASRCPIVLLQESMWVPRCLHQQIIEGESKEVFVESLIDKYDYFPSMSGRTNTKDCGVICLKELNPRRCEQWK